MGAGRDPVDRVLDVLVSTPLCAAIAARDAVPVLARAARHGLAAATRVLLVEDDRAGRRSASQPAPPSDAVTDTSDEPGAAEPNAVESDGAALPIDGYDHLAARQVVDRLAGLTRDELAVVGAHERAHRRRRTVLGKIEQLSGP